MLAFKKLGSLPRILKAHANISAQERGCDECLNTEEPGGRGNSRLQQPSRVHSSGTEDGAAVNGGGSQSPHHNTPARHSIGNAAHPQYYRNDTGEQSKKSIVHISCARFRMEKLSPFPNKILNLNWTLEKQLA